MSQVAATPAQVDADNPWFGLAPFTEAAQEYFHGRDDEVLELMRRVRRKTLTVLFGQSGLGKTSLLQAGLFPRLRRERFLPVYLRLDFAADEMAPVEQIRERLGRAIAEAGCARRAPQAGETLWECFHLRDGGLRDNEGRAVVPVLVFDQFEEIFTRVRNGRGDGGARDLIVALAELAENRIPAALEERFEEDDELAGRFDFSREDCRIVLSLREDYLPHLEGLRMEMPSLMQNRVRLMRMNGAAALEAVLKPGGELVAPGVGREIVRFVAGAPAGVDEDEPALERLELEPSLLSLVCRELNNKRRALGQSCITGDLLAGSSDAILQDFYERCLADQIPAVRSFIEDELLTDSGHRENMALERAERLLAQRGAPASALEQLIDRRLLRVEERLDVRRIELTHDILTGVVRASRTARRMREEKVEAEARQREAENQRHAAEEREREARQELRKARGRAVVLALLFVAALAAALWAWGAQQEAAQQRALAEAHRDAAEAARLQTEASVRLASSNLYEAQIFRIHSAWIGDRIGLAQALIDGAAVRPVSRDQPDLRHWEWYFLKGLCARGSRAFSLHENYINDIAFSSDGRWIATASGDGSVKLVEVSSGLVARVICHRQQFVGTGVKLDREGLFGDSIIIEVFPGSPAEIAGLQAGDRIVRASDSAGKMIDVATLGLSEMIEQLMQGAAGTVERLEVISRAAKVPRTVEIVRGEVKFEGGHDSFIGAVAFTPDDKRLVTGGGADRTVKLWSTEDGRLLWTSQPLTSALSRLAMSPDGRTVAAAIQGDSKVYLLDAGTGRPTGELAGHSAAVTDLAFHPDGRLASSSSEAIHLWDLATRERVDSLQGVIAANSLSISKDGRLAAGALAQLAVWDLAAPKSAPKLFTGHSGFITSVAFSPSGKRLAVADLQGSVTVWDVAKGEVVRTLKGHVARLKRVAFSPKGFLLASASDDWTVRIWDLRLDTITQHREVSVPDKIINSLACSSDGSLLAGTHLGGSEIVVVDAAMARTVGNVKSSATTVVFVPGGSVVAAPESDGTVRLYDARTGAEERSPKLHDGQINTISIRPDGKLLATGGVDQAVQLWDMESAAVRKLHGHTGPVVKVVFSPDGKYLASFGGQEVKIWDLEMEKEVSSFDAEGANCMRFHPDSRQLLVGSSNGQMFLSDFTGKVLLWFTGHTGQVFDVAFSPDGKRLFSVAGDLTLRLWNVESGRELLMLDEKSTVAWCVALSPDGWRLATGGHNRIALWDSAVLAVEGSSKEPVFHQTRAVLHSESSQWEEAARHWTRALELRPKDPASLWQRAHAYAELGRWDEALLDLDPSADGLDERDVRSIRSILLLEKNDLAGFRKERDAILAKLNADSSPDMVNTAAWMLCLVEEPPAVLQPIIEQMRKVVEAQPNSYNYCSTFGTLLYRAGQNREAVEELVKADAMFKSSPDGAGSFPAGLEGTPYDWLFLAMAHHRLANVEDSKRWYARALATMRADEAAEAEGHVGWYQWWQRFELERFRQEAAALIEGPGR